MDARLLARMRQLAQPVVVSAGQVVVFEGRPHRHLWCVADGRLVVTKRIRGEAESLLAHLGPGEMFGEVALIDHLPAAATVTAEVRTTLWRLDEPVVRALMRDPEFAWAVLRDLAIKVRQANHRLGAAVGWSLEATRLGGATGYGEA
jgi:CRP/FNR family transcriptional regulator